MDEPKELETHRAIWADLRAKIRDCRQEWMANVNAVREDIAGIRHLVDGSAEQASGLTETFENGFAMFDRGFAEMRERFDEAAAAQRHILELVTILVEKQRST